jgi:hypothetical protein
VHVDTVSLSAGEALVLDTIRPVKLAADTGATLLLDDFEDGDAENAFNSSWWTVTDANEDGLSAVTPAPGSDMAQAIAAPGAQSSAHCMHISFFLGNGDINFAGLGSNLALPYNGIVQSRDLSSLKKFSFRLRGSGAQTSVVFIPVVAGSDNITVFDIPAAPAEWTGYSVDIDSLLAVNDSIFRKNYMLGIPYVIQLDVLSNGKGGAEQELWIDDIVLEF